MFGQPVNTTIPMTRRYPSLPGKALKRDSKIVQRLMNLWDIKRDAEGMLNYFIKEKSNLSDERFWEILRTIWVLTGTIERLPLFIPLFRSSRQHRHYFMTPEEHKRLRDLADRITIYRACNDERGISWTLSKAYAEQYQKDFSKKQIIEKTVYKSRVFAFIERMGEEEIILLD